MEYEFNEETKSYIVRGMGEVKDSVVSIPSYYLGKPVTSIRYGAFRNCTSLESITIPKGVTEIGSWAFEGCVWLEKILLPDGILGIGTDAFLDTVFYETASNWVKDMLYIGKYLISTKENISGTCVIKPGTILIADSAFSERDQITSVTIPESVTSIGDEAFNKCSALTNVKFEGDSQLASIGYDAFYNCSSLTSIIIPASVTSIGKGAFDSCGSLENVTFERESHLESIGAWAFTGTAYFNDEKNRDSSGVLYIGNHLIDAKDTISGAYTVRPGTKTIGYAAFYSCNFLTSVVIPEGVTVIGDEAFNRCSFLKSIVIPDSVISIGEMAFYYCSSLTSITIPEKVTSIGDAAFFECSSLNAVYITDLAAWCEIDFGDDFGYISNPLYYAHRLYINGQEVTELKIPDKITEIKDYMFTGGGFASVTLHEDVTLIGSFAFAYCTSLESVTLPDGVTSIGERAFDGCNSLTSIMIPDSVTAIGPHAFRDCSGLKTVYYQGTAEEWGNISIDSYGNSYLTSATRYYFTEDAPTAEEWASHDYWWHYDPETNKPTPWIKENQ